MIAEQLNKIIKESSLTKELKTNDISDGYHTFGELYDHRIALFVALCNLLHEAIEIDREALIDDFVWKSKKHHDGTSWDGWFIAGIGEQKNFQISYHLPMDKWELLRVTELEKAPEWDGHTPQDVVKRLLNI